MFEKGKMVLIFAETPLHPGSGSGIGGIDLPVQRETFLEFPVIASSGLKGALRDFFEKKFNGDNRITVVFGPEGDKASEHAGAIGLTDARILLFPVRSLKGVFAYLTCPLILKRLKRDLEYLTALDWKINDHTLDAISGLSEETLSENEILISQNSEIRIEQDGRNLAVLEEYTFSEKVNPENREKLGSLSRFFQENLPSAFNIPERIALVSDDIMVDFLKFSTEVYFRNRIDDDKGTVANGFLWSEEYIPMDSVFYSLLFATSPLKKNDSIPSAEEVLNFLQNAEPDYLWIGGDTTVGKGLVRIKFL